jgi:hypothetical protein
MDLIRIGYKGEIARLHEHVVQFTGSIKAEKFSTYRVPRYKLFNEDTVLR